MSKPPLYQAQTDKRNNMANESNNQNGDANKDHNGGYTYDATQKGHHE